jgi:hypothetical protein
MADVGQDGIHDNVSLYLYDPMTLCNNAASALAVLSNLPVLRSSCDSRYLRTCTRHSLFPTLVNFLRVHVVLRDIAFEVRRE